MKRFIYSTFILMLLFSPLGVQDAAAETGAKAPGSEIIIRSQIMASQSTAVYDIEGTSLYCVDSEGHNWSSTWYNPADQVHWSEWYLSSDVTCIGETQFTYYYSMSPGDVFIQYQFAGDGSTIYYDIDFQLAGTGDDHGNSSGTGTFSDMSTKTASLVCGTTYGETCTMYTWIRLSTTPFEHEENPPLVPPGCEDDYLIGAELGEITIDATDAVGESLSALTGWPPAGRYVMLEITSGSWQDDGVGEARTDLAIKTNYDDWTPLEDDVGFACKDETAASYYLQVHASTYHIRVNDTDTFPANTGSVTVTVYLATYQARAGACESRYALGNMIEDKTVAASLTSIPMADGVTGTYLDKAMPMGGEEVFRYLAIEVNKGPYNDGEGYSSIGQVYDGSTWYHVADLPTAVCVTELDALGKVRVYFPYTSDLFDQLWKYRAEDRDGMRTNNQGMSGYSLYYADDLQTLTVPCSNHYSHADTGTEYVINADDDVGVEIELTGNTDGDVYAIETSGGPWHNNGTPSYDIAISNDAGVTYSLLQDYEYALCADEESNTVLIYVRALAGYTYSLRVYDATETFTNNIGYMTATVYDGHTDIGNWFVCSDSFSMETEINIPDASRMIPAQNEGGITVNAIITGHQYAIEITDESTWDWDTDLISPKDLYAAQISDDGGQTWTIFPDADWDVCTVRIDGGTGDEDLGRYRIYFIASGSGNYRLRVYDNDPSWEDNQGYIMYKLYEMEGGDITDEEGSTDDDTTGATWEISNPSIPPSWGSACYETCQRPDFVIVNTTFSLGSVDFDTLGVIEFPDVTLPIPAVADWIEYSRCAIQKYFTICPEHISALTASIQNVPEDVEPFATGSDIKILFTTVSTTISSYDWYGGIDSTGGEMDPVFGGEPGESFGGETSEQGLNLPQMLVPGSSELSKSPWFGGDIDLVNEDNSVEPSGGEGDLYSPACQLSMYNILGDTAVGYCEAMYQLRAINVIPTIMIVLSFVLIAFMAFRYLPAYVHRWGELLKEFFNSF